ncbi:hypothetical protein HC251_07155 [Iamia sp. SCSIO 61187]|uniref:hypothetical protein n=1 Tax=Iamia sp. SCSIO 61187 TaxID=2722752 RepID=UPI001C63763A|nr:hypothetical protein [Iamia sp. SCSIO 61187]QYG92235.1 hypothetical protein HC251_07155 [Iamia sp. SCSIO 61187]
MDAPTVRRRTSLVVAVAMAFLLAACDIGWEGPSYEGASGSPSGSKPESKVWFHDGRWWGSLYDTASGDHHIFWLDVAAGQWHDTGVPLDPRPNSRADVLWDGSHLYVASHVFTDGSPRAGRPSQLHRFSYDDAQDTWRPDPGFPEVINDVATETLVIDKDATGRLWATWVQDGTVLVTSTTNVDRGWAAPSAVPGATGLDSDDISSLVAFTSPTGPRVGVMWSDQNSETVRFTSRLALDPVGLWSPTEIAFSGPRAADDHISMRAVQDIGGRLLAVVKTSASGGSNALVVVLDRTATGSWSAHPFGTVADAHTRPVLAVDAEQRIVHVFATSGQSGGSIYEKTAPLDDLVFPPGVGREVLKDEDSPDINNATTTKQLVSSATGLVVVATNDSTRRYWTHHDPLAPPPPTDERAEG